MAASPPTSHPDPSAAVLRIALQVGATPVAHVGIGALLAGVCSALPRAAGVAAAALVLTEPADPRDPEGRQVFASDDAAHRLGLIQHRAGRGPVPAAVRGDRPLVVPDLTVGGPPELAAAAADCGLVRSLVVPLSAAGRTVGGLQLLAGPDTALDEQSAAGLGPLVSALAARLADARELALAGTPAVVDAPGDEHADVEEETVAVPTADEPDAAGPGAAEGTTVRLQAVAPAAAAEITGSDPLTDMFAAGETTDETPPTGQARLGWDGPEHTPRPTALPGRALPARVPLLGRTPRPTPFPGAVPEQRSGPTPAALEPAPAGSAPVAAGPVPEPGSDRGNGVDDPTWRVPRHRLRDDA